ncbi:hypothetical protein DM02DRAFT_693274 [Periconia macrospinosa]|uniref:Uncharacterized protein n=1 Tax=Periconia macrospinosa TaxID=97972 RepID=A0A2V1E1A5_9PLEO|nr:hypothetical protein DM02DRAFT_693274 [Periconia macrospinosa]
MLFLLSFTTLLLQTALAAPLANPTPSQQPQPLAKSVVSATQSTICTSEPILSPESTPEDVTIEGTIQSKKTSAYLNIANASTSYKLLSFRATGTRRRGGLRAIQLLRRRRAVMDGS